MKQHVIYTYIHRYVHVRRHVTSSDGTGHVMQRAWPVVRDQLTGRRWLPGERDGA